MKIARMQAERPPGLLVVAAALLTAESVVVLFTAETSTALDVVQLGIALLLAVFLLRGSKLAWVLTLLGSATQIISSLIEARHWWASGATAILVTLLFAPTSMTFVWSKSRPRPMSSGPSSVRAWVERIISFSYYAVARLAHWETDLNGRALSKGHRAYGLLLWRLGGAIVLLLLLTGAIHVWQEGSARGSLIVDVLASLVWTCYMIAQVAFIWVLVLAALGRFRRGSNSGHQRMS